MSEIMPGAVDLGGLKGPTDQQKEAVYAQLLDQLGLVCHSCGAPIGEDGIEVIAIVEQRQGAQLGVNVLNWPYCGRDCAQKDLGVLEGISIKLALRRVAPVEWIKGTPCA